MRAGRLSRVACTTAKRRTRCLLSAVQLSSLSRLPASRLARRCRDYVLESARAPGVRWHTRVVSSGAQMRVTGSGTIDLSTDRT